MQFYRFYHIYSHNPGDFVLDRDPAPLPKKGAETPPQFCSVFIVLTLLAGRQEEHQARKTLTRCDGWHGYPSAARYE